MDSQQSLSLKIRKLINIRQPTMVREWKCLKGHLLLAKQPKIFIKEGAICKKDITICN